MSRKITVSIERCMGCHTCELACAIAHASQTVGGEADRLGIEAIAAAGLRPGYRIHVEHYGPKAIPLACQHCDVPACELACPTGAVRRLAPGKPVLVDEAKCIGCSMCVQACPFGVMAMRSNGKVAFKCDLCVQRLAKGLQPACVSSCPTRALRLEEGEQESKDKRQAAVRRLAAAQAAGAQEAR
jgi:carbon-monoxide dehydrogenase iron sulfur subunit